jgi:DNA-damage-inducible protein D
MESKQLKLIFQTLDDVRHQNGQEYWYARELFPCLGYSKWENFLPVIQKAKEACKNSGSSMDDHFLDVQKMVTLGSGGNREIPDIKLTRYASYLIAVNGDPRKQEIAFAQAYFVTQTRKFELMEKRMEELERLDAREKLKITEKEFGALAFARGVDGRGIALIRSRGDEELFGKKKTEDMKKRLGVSNDKPLADVLPTVTLKAKDLATAMTTENARKKNLYGLVPIGKEHVANNQSIREALVKSDIYPENLPAGENIKAIEARHRKELKALQIKQKKELEQAQKNIKDK